MQSAVLVDAQPLWLDAVEDVLRSLQIQTVAKTRSLAQASEALSALWPDVVVAETTLAEDVDAGLGWVRETSQAFGATKLVVFSASSNRDHVDATLAAGADAFVLKCAPVDDFRSAIKQLFNRSVFLRPTSSAPAEPPRALLPTLTPLTHRELDILRLAAEGHSNARIARILWITEQTVKFHLSNIYRKIQVANRTEASRWAQLHGVLRPEPAHVA